VRVAIRVWIFYGINGKPWEIFYIYLKLINNGLNYLCKAYLYGMTDS